MSRSRVTSFVGAVGSRRNRHRVSTVDRTILEPGEPLGPLRRLLPDEVRKMVQQVGGLPGRQHDVLARGRHRRGVVRELRVRQHLFGRDVLPERRPDALLDLVEYQLHTNPWGFRANIARHREARRPAKKRVPMALRAYEDQVFSPDGAGRDARRRDARIRQAAVGDVEAQGPPTASDGSVRSSSTATGCRCASTAAGSGSSLGRAWIGPRSSP
jgi:hypothetical protein